MPVSDVLHGVRVDDPYRNLEDLKNPRTRAWLEAQGRYGAAQLARIQGRDAIARSLAEYARNAGDQVHSVRRMPGGQVFYMERQAGEDVFRLMVRQGSGGAPRVLVDPALLMQRSGVPHAVNYFEPSWDGRLLAYGVSAGGSEDASLHVMDIASGQPVGDPVPRVIGWGGVSWAPDSHHLAYTQLRQLPAGAPDTETYLDATAWLLDTRQPTRAPRAIFGRELNRELQLDRLDFAGLIFSPDSRQVIARTTDTTVPEGKLFVAPVAALLAGGAVPWRQIASAADRITGVYLRSDTLVLRTTAGALRGRVLALPLADPVLARATEVIPEPRSAVLEELSLGRDAIYAELREGFNTRVRRFADGRPGAPAEGVDIAPQRAGSTFLMGDPGHAHGDVWVGTSSWTEPPRLLEVAADGRIRDTGLRNERVPAGAPEIVVSEVLVPSHDGARVPLAVLHRKGLLLDGSNPTLLIGYGSYGLSIEARFNTNRLAWLERGGVVALANPRGSGAYGEAWYRAGFKATKANTWKDGIACARWLIEQKYASPATLGIWGTSAGGIFVGRAVTAAPELFAAAVFDVGVMDAVRAEDSANGITNISEFGSYRNPQEFPALLEMSTYHHIKAGTAYPAVLLVHGMNDPRVDVWHSAKAAARLQASSTSSRPVLMRLDEQAGHGVGSTAQQSQSASADIYAFLLWQMGKLEAP